MKTVSIKIAGRNFQLASRSRRLWAFFIDALILSVATLILYWVLGWLGIRTWHPKLFQIASLLLWLFGLTFMEGFSGRSPGKDLMDIRVLRLKDGRPINFTDAFFRRLTMILLPLDLIWMLSEKRQRLGDQLVKTVIVKFSLAHEHYTKFGSPAPETSIKIAGRDFELGDRFARLFAFFIDVLPLVFIPMILLWLALEVYSSYIDRSYYVDPGVIIEKDTIEYTVNIIHTVVYAISIGLWIFGLLFLDGFNGRSPGKALMKLRVIRLKDGTPCNLKSALWRRLTIVLQPFDVIICILHPKGQRIGDRLAGTIVVKFDPATAAKPMRMTPEEVLEMAGKDPELTKRTARSSAQSIRIGRKEFALADRLARFFAFSTDVLLLISATVILRLLAFAVSAYYFARERAIYYANPSTVDPAIIEINDILPMFGIVPIVFYTATAGLWILGLLFLDGFSGRSPGKAMIGIQVLRLKDGNPCNLKNAFLRRLTIVLQPFDLISTFGPKWQRIGDKLAGTVVVATTIAEVVPETEPSIRIARQEFELAPLKLRLSAFLIDVSCLLYITFFVTLIAYPNPEIALLPFRTVQSINLGLWIFGLFFMDGFNGCGPGKRAMSIQVVRLKNGRPGGFKDAFLRRIASVLAPLDLIPSLGKKRQRLGDKLAGTVVVKSEQEVVIVDLEAENNPIGEPEEVLGVAILEMKSRLSKAREQVDASIEAEKQFQTSYEDAVAQAEQAQASAVTALQAEDEDIAREALQKRNKHRRLADGYEKQYEEQKQVVQSFKNTLEYLQRKMMEAQVKKAVIVAQHRNTNAQTHLRKMLAEIEESEPFETFVETEQRVTKESALEKAAAEMDTAYQDAELEREFEGNAEETSIDKELAELKAKLQ